MSGGPTQPGYQLTGEDYARIQPKLLARIRRGGFAAEDAEDLVQKTFLQAQRSLNQERFHGQSALDTWIIGIAKNLCLKQRKTRGTVKRSGHEVPIDPPRDDDTAPTIQLSDDRAGPEEKTGDRQVLELVLRAICRLPEKIRAPLVLFAHGHTYEQIARLLRISPDLVTSRLGQARAKLRQAVPRPPRGSPR